MSRLLHVLGVVWLLGACANAPADPDRPTAQDTKRTTERSAVSNEAAVGPVIGTLQRQHDALVIMATSDGPRFAVRGADGSTIARGLTEAELSREFRALHRVYRTSVARGTAGPFLDARVNPPSPAAGPDPSRKR